jgi:hypothetical protein
MRKQFIAAGQIYAPSFSATEVKAATDVCQRARALIQV